VSLEVATTLRRQRTSMQLSRVSAHRRKFSKLFFLRCFFVRYLRYRLEKGMLEVRTSRLPTGQFAILTAFHLQARPAPKTPLPGPTQAGGASTGLHSADREERPNSPSLFKVMASPS